jgi:ferric iron reductase protein FhuF
MTELLAPLFQGPLEEYRGSLVLHDDPRPAITADRLFTEPTLLQATQGFARRFNNSDRRAVLSLWSKRYFTQLLMPCLSANLILDRQLPLSLAEVAWVLADDGLPVSLKLANEGETCAAGTPAERFENLVRGHLQPAIEALAHISGASAKVFWSNAGNVIEFILRSVARLPRPPLQAVADGEWLLTQTVWPDGWRNPLRDPIRYVAQGDGEAHRQRRLCCIAYLIPDTEYCGNCPLPAKGSRRHCAASSANTKK